MMKGLPDDRATAVLAHWAALELGGRVHFVGVLVGGHDRLPEGAWMITSPVREFNAAERTAITASTGRRYALGTRLLGPLPDGARDVVAHALAMWRIDGPAPDDALTDAQIVEKLARPSSPEPDATVVAPFETSVARVDRSGGGDGR